MKEILGNIRQNAYVVRNLFEGIKYWTDVMGVGPFFLLDHITMPGFTYHGKPSQAQISVGLSHHGSLQIELIEQHNDEPSMWRDFLQSGGNGLHHVACWTTDYDRDRANILARGFEIGHASEVKDPNLEVSSRFAYLYHDQLPGMVVELLERNAPGDYMQAKIEEAARNWDGTDPIRTVASLF